MTALTAPMTTRPTLSVRQWATRTGKLAPTERLLLILLSDKVDRTFSCTPTLSTLTAESGAGRSTVLRTLKQLEDHALIKREPQFTAAGRRLSTRYILNCPLAQRRYCPLHDHPRVAIRAGDPPATSP